MTRNAEALERAHAIFDPIAQVYVDRDGVDIGRMFASEGLRIRSKIFAFLGFDGELMVKLPVERTAQLVDAAYAERVIMQGRAMREWVYVSAERPELWEPLMAEAYAYLDEITP